MPAPIIPHSPKGISQAAACVESGGLLVFPTETVYGLGVDLRDTGAIRRIFAVKGREREQALPVLIAAQDQLDQVVSSLPPDARTLIDRFWPGPLTLVLPAHDRLPRVLTGGLPTVAVRQTASPVASALIEHLGKPLTGTSANRSGQPAATTAADAAATFGNDVDLILDGGPSSSIIPSTIVDVSGPSVTILRPGRIEETAVHAALSE